MTLKPTLAFSFITAFLLLSCTSNAQSTAVIQTDTFPRSEFYFAATYCVPYETFAKKFSSNGDPNLSASLTKSIERGGFGATPGFEGEASGYFYFDRHPSGSSGGIKITFLSFASIPFNWHSSGDYIFNTAQFKRLNYFSFKIGPAARFVLWKKNFVRVAYQLGLGVGWNGAWNYFDTYDIYEGDYKYSVTDNSEFKLGSGVGLKSKFATGININNFIFEIGYDFGSINYNSIQYERHADVKVYRYDSTNGSYTFQELVRGNADATAKASAPTSFFTFSAGYKF